MKIIKPSFNMTAMVIAMIIAAVFAVSAQDIIPDTALADSLAGFDIEKVNVSDTAFAETGGGSIADHTRQPESYALVLFRIIGFLVMTVLIIFAVAWGVRKMGVAGVSKVGAGQNMDIIENMYIGQNRGAALIRVADAVYLIGHTPENIVMLEKIEGQKALDLIASSKGAGTITNFKDAFNNFLGKMKK